MNFANILCKVFIGKNTRFNFNVGDSNESNTFTRQSSS